MKMYLWYECLYGQGQVGDNNFSADTGDTIYLSVLLKFPMENGPWKW